MQSAGTATFFKQLFQRVVHLTFLLCFKSETGPVFAGYDGFQNACATEMLLGTVNYFGRICQFVKNRQHIQQHKFHSLRKGGTCLIIQPSKFNLWYL